MRVRCAVAFLVFVLKALSARFADAQADAAPCWAQSPTRPEGFCRV